MAIPPRVLDTRDVDEARRTVAAGYCEHRLDITGPSRAFHAVQTECQVGRVRVHRLRYGTDLAIEAAPLRSTVLVTSPRRGQLVVETDSAQRILGPRDVLAIDPDAPFALRWLGDCELHTVQLDRTLLTEAGAHPSRSLAGARVLESRRAGTWHRLLSLLEESREQTASPLLQDHLEGVVAAMVVANHDVAAEVDPRIPATSRRDLRRAVDFVEAHAEDPVRATDIAAAAHLSVRALQSALRAHLDLTPSELLRSVRLARAHEELVRATPDETTVGAIAHRWGFGHPGRFARYYEARYGIPPSQTLRS